MTFDYQSILDNIKAVLQTTWDVNAPQIQTISEQYAIDAAKRLAGYAAKLAEDNDTDFFFERLKEEPKILESELLSLEVIGKVIADGVIKSFFQILLDALIKFIGDNIPKIVTSL